jgi:hypothetical protein
MDALTRAAVAGTSREKPPASGLPTDGLFESAAGKSPQRELLLRAGTRAVYRAAGRLAESGIEAPQPAPDETVSACSAKAAELLGRLLVDQRTSILVEALERLRLAGLRLPHALLPGAMNVVQELRPAVVAVLGERGRWLARLNPEWAWAVGDEGDLRDVWDEGDLKERTSVLRRVRGRDPALGRAWLSETWRQEKADARSAMLEAFEENLSPEDEPYLESSLGDRSMKVRAVAADLLARLPGSAYALRNAERAEAIIAGYEPPSTGFLGLRRSGKLMVEIPPAVDEEWKRELPGEASPPRKISERAWTVVRTLEVIPPVYWERRFGATPEELVAAARGEWEAVLLTGWRRAAVRHGQESWAWPLWRRWHEAPETQHDLTSTLELLAPLLPHAELGGVLRRSGMSRELAYTMNALPGPWDEELSLLYLEELRKHVPRIFVRNRDASDPWLGTPQPAAERIALSCLDHATVLQPDEVLPERMFSDGQVLRYYWREKLEKFEETLELRRRLVKEIPL